jgi:hypothetical protein
LVSDPLPDHQDNNFRGHVRIAVDTDTQLVCQ